MQEKCGKKGKLPSKHFALSVYRECVRRFTRNMRKLNGRIHNIGYEYRIKETAN